MPTINHYFNKAYDLYPALIAVIVLIIGAITGIYCGIIPILVSLIFTLAITCILLYIKGYRAIFGRYILLLFVYFIGAVRGYYSIETPNILSKNDSAYDVRINTIVDNDNSMHINGSIIAAYDSIDSKCETNDYQDIILTIQNIDYSLFPGTVIKVPNKLKLIENLGNPDEFDYQAYINRRGIFYRGYFRNNDYSIVGESITLMNRIERIKMKLNNRILVSELSPDSKYFLSAVLIGDRHNLSIDTRNLYSNIGIAHVLALSGLHVGIISLLVYFLLFPLDYIIDRRYRMAISIILLIIYAIITGLSISVVRATLIALVCGVGYCLRRKISPINLLAFVAFILVLFNPLCLFDIGFQLSFMAVLFIILFANKINPVSQRNAIAYSIVSMITVTLSASMGTFMLSAYYFHVIPVLFLIPNLLLIPLMPTMLCIGIIAVTTGLSPFIHIFDWLYSIINKLFIFINNIEFSHIDNVNITIFDLIIYYSIMLCLCILIYGIIRRKRLYVILLSVSMCIWIFLSNISKQGGRGLVIMNHYKETPIIVYDNDKANIVFPTDSIGFEYLEEFRQYNKSFLAKRNIKSIEQSDTILNNEMYGIRYFDFMEKRLILVDGKLTKDTLPKKDRIRCNYLVITKNYYASMNRILTKIIPDTIILSGNIYPQRRFKLISQIEESKLPYYDINESGAFLLQD